MFPIFMKKLAKILLPREHKKQNLSFPSFRLKTAGEDALLTRPKEARVPLFMSDLQALLTFCLVGDEAPYHPHRSVSRIFTIDFS